MSVPIIYPLIVKDETGELEFFDDLVSLNRSLEAPDVRGDVYSLFDAHGRPDRLIAVKPPGHFSERIEIEFPADALENLGALEEMLREFLRVFGQPAEDGLGLDQLMQKARAVSAGLR